MVSESLDAEVGFPTVAAQRGLKRKSGERGESKPLTAEAASQTSPRSPASSGDDILPEPYAAPFENMASMARIRDIVTEAYDQVPEEYWNQDQHPYVCICKWCLFLYGPLDDRYNN